MWESAGRRPRHTYKFSCVNGDFSVRFGLPFTRKHTQTFSVFESPPFSPKRETFENGVAPSLQGRAFQDGGQTLDNCRFYFAVDFKTNICSTNAQYDKAAGFYDCLNTRVKRLRKKSKRTSKS